MNTKFLDTKDFGINLLGEDEVFVKTEISNNHYISNYGRVYNINNRQFVHLTESGGILKFSFHNKQYIVHTMVGRLFIENNNNFTDIKHINGIKTDNYYKNLEWVSRGYGRRLDLTSQVFGFLQVIEKDSSRGYGKNGVYWKCKCNYKECDNIVSVASGSLKKGGTISCGCYIRDLQKNNKKEKSAKWKGHGEISSSLYSRIKRDAWRREIEFSVTIEFLWDLFLKQDRKCALSGTELKFSSNSNLFDSNTSLDRKDSSGHYTEDNVQWILSDINIMKNRFDQDYFINICKQIANYK